MRGVAKEQGVKPNYGAAVPHYLTPDQIAQIRCSVRSVAQDAGEKEPMSNTEQSSISVAPVEPAREYTGMVLVVPPAEAKRRLAELQSFVHSTMVKGEDYGVIQGMKTPSLFQPGAQKLAEIYGFAHRFVTVEAMKDWERGFFYFEYRCLLTSRRDDSFVGEGLGSANSRESKYAARWVFGRDVPAGLDKSQLKTKTIATRRGPAIMHLVPNEDPYSLVNTIQKMAAKRAYVHAVVAATRSSAIFTQDVEDMPREVLGQQEEEPGHDPETGEVEEKDSLVLEFSHAMRESVSFEDFKAVCRTVAAAESAGKLSDAQKQILVHVRNAEIAKRAPFGQGP